MYAKNFSRKNEKEIKMNTNFIEKDTVQEANEVDLSIYRWSERMSAKTGKYIFILRQIKKKD